MSHEAILKFLKENRISLNEGEDSESTNDWIELFDSKISDFLRDIKANEFKKYASSHNFNKSKALSHAVDAISELRDELKRNQHIFS